MATTGIAGKIAFVTGAAGGIGAAVVQALHREGARVVGCDADSAGLAALADAGEAGKQPLIVHELDVRNESAVEATIASVERDLGPIEIGINVAGVLRPSLITETDQAAWQLMFDVNATGVFHVSRALARRMMPRRRGAIITVSSNAGGVPRHGMAAYAASKAAATMFTRCLGLELGTYGIRCNVVAPGSTRTPMLTDLWAEGGSEQSTLNGSLETFRTGIPLARIAEPADVAGAVVFLASDEARQITMAELYVDGGAALRA